MLGATATNIRHGRVWRLNELKIEVCRSDDAVIESKISKHWPSILILQDRMALWRVVPCKLLVVDGVRIETGVS